MGARSLCNILFAVERYHKLVSSRDCIRQVSGRMGSNLTSGMLWVSVTKTEGLLPFRCVVRGALTIITYLCRIMTLR